MLLIEKHIRINELNRKIFVISLTVHKAMSSKRIVLSLQEKLKLQIFIRMEKSERKLAELFHRVKTQIIPIKKIGCNKEIF